MINTMSGSSQEAACLKRRLHGGRFLSHGDPVVTFAESPESLGCKRLVARVV